MVIEQLDWPAHSIQFFSHLRKINFEFENLVETYGVSILKLSLVLFVVNVVKDASRVCMALKFLCLDIFILPDPAEINHILQTIESKLQVSCIRLKDRIIL